MILSGASSTVAKASVPPPTAPVHGTFDLHQNKQEINYETRDGVTTYQPMPDGTVILFGDATDNVIVGADGVHNLIDGGYGNDTITGGDGADTFRFMAVASTNEKDVITDFQAGVDKIEFTARESDEITIDQDGTNVLIRYGSNSQVLILNADAEDVRKAFVLNKTVVIEATPAISVLPLTPSGVKLVDTINFLMGKLEDDVLSGTDGVFDIIDGGAGSDQLTGGAGEDLFRFTTDKSGAGDRDTITDFEAGTDRIEVLTYGQDQLSFVQQGADVLIQLGSGGIVEVRNATVEDVREATISINMTHVDFSALVILGHQDAPTF